MIGVDEFEAQGKGRNRVVTNGKSEAGSDAWLDRLKFRKQLFGEFPLHLASLLTIDVVAIAI